MAESQTTDYALVWETSASLASQSRLSLRPRVIGSSGKAFCSKRKFHRHFEEKKPESEGHNWNMQDKHHKQRTKVLTNS